MTTNSPNPVDGDVQALIVWAKGYIESAERLVENNPSDASAKAYLKLLQVSLAALKAEPEYNTSDEGGEIFLEVSKAEYDKCHEDYRWISYPAPPAQLLRPLELPESHRMCNGYYFDMNDVFEALEEAGIPFKVKS